MIVTHPLTAAIGFTGSFRGGKALFDAAARRDVPIPVYAEMGSTNPVFILAGALRERGNAIARDLVNSVTLGVGQFCTKPGVVFVTESDGHDATRRFIKSVADLISAAPAETMLTKGIKRGYDEGIEELGAIEGVLLVSSGHEEEGRCQGIPTLFRSTVRVFLDNPRLDEEIFGPATIIFTASTQEELLSAARRLKGHLTATVHGTEDDDSEISELVDILERKVGRLILNGFPTGVEVCSSMHHGGPFPATTDPRSTSVGTAALARFVRPICYQGFSDSVLPDELKQKNPRGIYRLVDGDITRK
jgi:NADP-dependent aldehyde dehydrogenase